ncbi:MAG: monovalent cation/H+ antiporter subunit D family protein [Planctomycetota bacterium]
MSQPAWPIAMIVLPMLAAPVLVLVGSRRFSQFGAIAVSWGMFAIASQLLQSVQEQGIIRYHIGGWLPPYGIEYVVDPFSSYVMWFVSFIGAIVVTYAGRSVEDEVAENKQTLFYATYLLCITGLLGMCITGDLFNVFVFLEISSLSSYALISLGKSRRAPLAALQYLIVGTVGATFFLIGIGLLYQMTGTLNMAGLAERLPRESGSRTLIVAFSMMTVGLFVKMAVFPLHTWLPNAYCYAPSAVTAMIAATSTKISIYAFIRLIYTIFTDRFAFDALPLGEELAILALLGIYVASLAAIFQDDVKRLLAYSSVAQIGYMLLGISFNTSDGLAAAQSHLFNHAIIKGGLFMAVGAVVYQTGSCHLDAFRGLSRRMPYTAMAMAIGLLALIGVPATAGFVTKWMLLTSAIESGNLVIAAMMLLSSLLAVVYCWKIVEAMYFAEPMIKPRRLGDAPRSMIVTTGLVIGLAVVLGLWTPWSAGLATQAAEFLTGVR